VIIIRILKKVFDTVTHPSDNTLLAKAIQPAINDRETYADAVGRDSISGVEALDEAARIALLRRKKLENLSITEMKDAMLTFIFAEQYELGFADCHPGLEYEKRARKHAALYREVRLRRWGKTPMEKMMDGAKSVSIFDLIN
jgi:hypothetical protein